MRLDDDQPPKRSKVYDFEYGTTDGTVTLRRVDAFSTFVLKVTPNVPPPSTRAGCAPQGAHRQGAPVRCTSTRTFGGVSGGADTSGYYYIESSSPTAAGQIWFDGVLMDTSTIVSGMWSA